MIIYCAQHIKKLAAGGGLFSDKLTFETPISSCNFVSVYILYKINAIQMH
jgi:hypothetical protein